MHDEGRARLGIAGKEPGVAVRASVDSLVRARWGPSAVSSLPLAETIRKPASANVAAMRAANASGSPRAVSLIVSPMTSSTLGLSVLAILLSSFMGSKAAAPVRLPSAGWPALVKGLICRV